MNGSPRKEKYRVKDRWGGDWNGRIEQEVEERWSARGNMGKEI